MSDSFSFVKRHLLLLAVLSLILLPTLKCRAAEYDETITSSGGQHPIPAQVNKPTWQKFHARIRGFNIRGQECYLDLNQVTWVWYNGPKNLDSKMV